MRLLFVASSSADTILYTYYNYLFAVWDKLHYLSPAHNNIFIPVDSFSTNTLQHYILFRSMPSRPPIYNNIYLFWSMPSRPLHYNNWIDISHSYISKHKNDVLKYTITVICW